MMPEKSPIFIIDGSSFLYRAYYGMRPLQTSKGINVQAVYSFCRMIKKIIKDFSIEHIVIVWDSKGTNARHEMYPEYKANRQQAPLDLFEQKELILEFLTNIKIAQVAKIGIEADDLIASLAKKFNDLGYPIMIVSSDKDLAQIVTNDTIKIFDAFKEKIIDEKNLVEQYGFQLRKLPFYFALLGDASDNIPGVKGIGKKGATDLVIQFESLDDLYEHIEKIDKRRTRELLLEQKDNAYVSLRLFTLHDYPTDLKLEDTLFHAKNWDLALSFFQNLEFKTLAAEISNSQPTQKKINSEQQSLFAQESLTTNTSTPIPLHEKYRFILINQESDLIALCSKLKDSHGFAIDTETTGLDPMIDPCIGISIAYEIGTAYYIPFAHTTDSLQISLTTIRNHLGPILADATIHKYLHHAKFNQIVLHQVQLPLSGLTFDTLIAASLLVQDWQKKGLKNLSEFYLEESMNSFEDVVKEHKADTFAQIPLEQATQYAAADAHQTLQLKKLFHTKLVEEKLETLFYTIEMPLHDILVTMQLEGIYCDATILAKLNELVSKDIIRIEKEIYSYTDESINLNSPKQIKELLFDKLNLPTQKKSAKNTGFSTDAQVLATLSKLHPVPGLLLQYRELFKLKSTYIESLPTYINPITNKIHTSFNQTLVATGRLSSSNPNLQNIPTGNLGYDIDIRSAFQAQDEYVFLAADYSQIELRILAYLSQDAALLQAFLHDLDIHQQTATKLFNLPANQISSEQRNVGKTINFSILYGLTSFGLSKNLEISYKDAQNYIAAYFEQYPGIVSWMEKIVEFAKDHGYIQTLWGRKRYIPGIYEKNRNLYELAKRIAINSVVQGTASEIMKIGMINLQKELDKYYPQAKILLQIHDELIIKVHRSDLQAVQALTEKTLQSVVSWNIPLIVHIKSGCTWHEVTK